MILLLTLAMFASQQRGLWLRAMSIADSTKVPRICAVMDTLHITDAYVQIVVGGYAYYDSRILPRSELLVRSAGADYRPFETIYRICKDRKINVHAWVNALLAWSLEKRPDSSNHVLHRHPDWFLQDVFGRRMSEYSYQEWRRFGVEGLYLDPANPAVREHVADVVNEIAERFDVDGVHLDFIRYPGIWWSTEPLEEACLLSGLVSDTLQWMTLVRYCQLPFKLRWMTWNIWRLLKDRENNVNATISRAFGGASAKATSCAVTANPANARYKYGQAWWQWGDYMDFPVLMSYTPDVGLFQDMIDYAARQSRSSVMGIGVIWPDMEQEAAYEQRIAARRGAGFCFFDFESLDTLANLSLLSDTVNIVFDSLTVDSSRYRPVNSAFQDRPLSIYKGSEQHSHDSDAAFDFSRYVMSLSLNRTRDLKRLGLDSALCTQMIRSDAIAFEYINAAVFPLGTMLAEPPARLISFDSLCWGQGDSEQVRKGIMGIVQLNNHRKVYPLPLDRFAKAVFNATPGTRTLVETADGIYAFMVDKIVEDSVMMPVFHVPADLRPIFSFHTAMIKFDKLLQ